MTEIKFDNLIDRAVQAAILIDRESFTNDQVVVGSFCAALLGSVGGMEKLNSGEYPQEKVLFDILVERIKGN